MQIYKYTFIDKEFNFVHQLEVTHLGTIIIVLCVSRAMNLRPFATVVQVFHMKAVQKKEPNQCHASPPQAKHFETFVQHFWNFHGHKEVGHKLKKKKKKTLKESRKQFSY